MPSPLIDTPQALDAAIAASLQSRREKLLRAVRRQRILTRVAFGLSGCVALSALAAFLAGDPKAAALSAMTASMTFTSLGRLVGRKHSIHCGKWISRSRQFDGAAPEHLFHGPKGCRSRVARTSRSETGCGISGRPNAAITRRIFDEVTGR